MTWVDWDEKARDELADIWVAALPEERERFAGIVLHVERQIELNPLEVGESRTSRLRLAFQLPIAIWFRISDDALLARIVHVRRIRRRT